MAIKIGLDPGHGGNSSGTYSINTTKDKLYEKDHALELSLLIREHLLRNGFEVFMTRTTDINPGTVDKRAKMCVDAGCKYAVSIHFNGFENESANGTEVFVPYAEKGAGIEAGFHEVLGKYFKRRSPFARSNNYYNRNETFDKKLNVSTRKFEAVSSNSDYFGFIRTSWANGLSADLLEVCFLTNRNDFDTYIKNKEVIAEGLAKSIVEGYGKEYVPSVKVSQPMPEEEKANLIFRVQVGAFNKRANAEALLVKLVEDGYTGFIREEKM